MLEEINRTVCDHCSDFLFVYHKDYKENLDRENIKSGVYVVGNTIVEVLKNCFDKNLAGTKKDSHILLDIHRPENFKHKNRLKNIIEFATLCKSMYGIPVKFLNFKRTMSYLKKFKIDLSGLDVVELMSYKNFLKEQYHSFFMISDSGTAQEEPALLRTPVLVPRDFTERPQSVESSCSIMINANNPAGTEMSADVLDFISEFNPDTKWLGRGNTSRSIIKILKEKL
jgi:UDP-N-acetylglucosamine 2-epimerase (non-hydrolysing)